MVASIPLAIAGLMLLTLEQAIFAEVESIAPEHNGFVNANRVDTDIVSPSSIQTWTLTTRADWEQGCSDPKKLDRNDSSSRICPKGETQCQSDGHSHRSSRPG